MTKKLIKRKSDNPVSIQGYDGFFSGMVSLIEEARRGSARTVNAIITATYWEMGRRIVENEQSGRRRAGYGEALLKKLSSDLTSKFGRGFSRQNLQQMRQFYRAYPPHRDLPDSVWQIWKTPDTAWQIHSGCPSRPFFTALVGLCPAHVGDE